MPRQSDIAIRLSVKDGETVRKALKSMGKDGAAALKKIERSGKPASKSLKAVSRASNEAQDGIKNLASASGPLGNVLSALGPAGIAMAAGIGVGTLAVGKALSIASEAVTAFDELAKSADDLGLSTTVFQALDFAATRAGVDNFSQSLGQMKIRAAEARLGTGEMIEKLKTLNPELLKNIQGASGFEEQLRLVIGGLKSAKTETEFTTIAAATGGESFERMARALAETEGGLDGIITAAEDFNVIVPETILRRSEEMKTKMGEAAAIIDTNLKSAFFNLAPALVQTKLLLSEVTKEFVDFITTSDGEAFENALSANAAALDTTINSLEKAQKRLDILNKGGFRAVAEFGIGALSNTTALAARQEQQVEDLKSAKAALLAARIDIVRDNVAPASSADAENDDAENNDDETTKPDPAQLALERQAAQIRAELGDITGLVAIREKELAALVEKTRLTRAEANQVLNEYRAKLDGSAAAQKRWSDIARASLSPTEKLRAQIAQLNADYDAGKISTDVFNAANSALVTSLDKLAQSAHESSQEFKDAKSIIDEVNSANEKSLPLAERLAKEQARVNAFVKDGFLNAEQAAAHMDIYAKSLFDASEQARLLQSAQSALDGIINGQIDSVGDLAKAFGRALNQMIFDAILANRKISGSLGFGGFIGNVLSSFGGFLGITGATPTVPAGGIPRPGNTGALVAHTGIRVGIDGPAATRSLPAQSFASAPRLHEGLLPGEFPAVLQRGEEVISVNDRSSSLDLIRAAIAIPPTIIVQPPANSNPSADAGLKVIVENQTGNRVQAQQRQGSNGQRELVVTLRNITNGLIANGSFDDSMNRRFGAKPVVGRV